MASIEIFKNESFGEVRVAGTSEEPLFCLADLCSVLDLRPNDVRQRLVDGVVSTHPITDSLGREQQANFVNEDGMYDVILDSRKPQAKAFRKWITSEVLPSIRKTGQYSVQQHKLPQTYLEALKALVSSEEEKQQLALENKIMQPKAAYFDNLVDRNMLTNLRDTAKQIHLTQNKFISLLLENKFVYRDAKKKLKPYAEYIPLYFEIKDFERNGHAGTQLLVNPKGKETFRLMWGGQPYEN